MFASKAGAYPSGATLLGRLLTLPTNKRKLQSPARDKLYNLLWAFVNYVYCLWVRQELTWLNPLSDASLWGRLLNLPTKIRQGLKDLPRKNSDLYITTVKSFITLGQGPGLIGLWQNIFISLITIFFYVVKICCQKQNMLFELSFITEGTTERLKGYTIGTTLSDTSS
jgi:hypothetical protein